MQVEKITIDFIPYQGRIAGAALLLSILSILAGLLIVAVQGKFQGLAAGFRGVEGIGEAASWRPGWAG